MKKYLLIALGAFLSLATGCAGASGSGDASDPGVITGSIEMEDGGVIAFELYYDIAPQAVKNFVHLAQDGFYDGLRFHRIMHGFMIQGGCPFSRDFSGDPGTGNPGYSITGEFAENGFENNLSHTRGVISMARGGHFDSAGSQFFICHGDAFGLDGNYAAFGKVTDGMDIVDKIAETPNSGRNGAVDPNNMPVIRTITIDGDVDLPEPDKLRRR
jgi:peptidyl-prolyl cis-trans isomerase B (cyclophilin B)